ncbi:MAG: hypothetical protein AAF447_22615 [Myxococcota bacterium]
MSDEGEAPQYRHDPLSDAWRIVAPARRGVPLDARRAEEAVLPAPAGRCPFCPGSEKDTEETTWQDPATGPWQVRVVANKYPVLRATGLDVPQVGGGHARPGAGLHEVIVEGRAHDADLVDADGELLRQVFHAYRARVRAIEDAPGIRHVSLFRNRGRRAGSSQPHPHAQVVGATVLGPEVQRRWERAREHERREGRTLLATVLARELRLGDRIVETTDRSVAFCPFAPAHPYESWVMPRVAGGAFAAMEDAALNDLAAVVQRTVHRALRASGRTAYNLIFRLPPAEARHDAAAFWHVEVLPRSGPVGALELTSGMAVVWVTPEDAAARMRALSPSPSVGS